MKDVFFFCRKQQITKNDFSCVFTETVTYMQGILLLEVIVGTQTDLEGRDCSHPPRFSSSSPDGIQPFLYFRVSVVMCGTDSINYLELDVRFPHVAFLLNKNIYLVSCCLPVSFHILIAEVVIKTTGRTVMHDGCPFAWEFRSILITQWIH